MESQLIKEYNDIKFKKKKEFLKNYNRTKQKISFFS